MSLSRQYFKKIEEINYALKQFLVISMYECTNLWKIHENQMRNKKVITWRNFRVADFFPVIYIY